MAISKACLDEVKEKVGWRDVSMMRDSPRPWRVSDYFNQDPCLVAQTGIIQAIAIY